MSELETAAPPLRVAILAFDGISLFHLSVPGMVLGTANFEAGAPRYEIGYCAGTPGPIRSDQGTMIKSARAIASSAARRRCGHW